MYFKFSNFLKEQLYSLLLLIFIFNLNSYLNFIKNNISPSIEFYPQFLNETHRESWLLTKQEWEILKISPQINQDYAMSDLTFLQVFRLAHWLQNHYRRGPRLCRMWHWASGPSPSSSWYPTAGWWEQHVCSSRDRRLLHSWVPAAGHTTLWAATDSWLFQPEREDGEENEVNASICL